MLVREENHHLITTPVWGPDYGMEGARQQSWAWGVLVAQSVNGCMGLNCSSFHTVASLSLHFPCHSPLYRPLKKANGNEILIKVDCPLSFSVKRPKKLVESSNESSRISLNYALLPPWIFLMIPHRQSTVIPLWNTLWWNRPLCVS